jgi:hypothetical protein
LFFQIGSSQSVGQPDDPPEAKRRARTRFRESPDPASGVLRMVPTKGERRQWKKKKKK